MGIKNKILTFYKIQYYFWLMDLAELKYRHFRKRKMSPEEEEYIEGQVVVVTGAGQGIGKVTALEFAKRKAVVVLGCVDMKQGVETAKDIAEKTGNENIEAIHLDLSEMAAVEKFASEVSSKYPEIKILVNNGGLGAARKGNQKTKDGFNLHMAVNYLGHFLLTNLLLENLKRSKDGRVVAITSTVGMLSIMDLDDFMMDKTSMGLLSCLPYSNSCFANSLFMKELGKRTKDQGVTTISLCPGTVRTEIWEEARFTKFRAAAVDFVLWVHAFTPEQAVLEFVMHSALSKKLKKHSGKMIRYKVPFTSGNWRLNSKLCTKLWNHSSELVNLENRISEFNKDNLMEKGELIITPF